MKKIIYIFGVVFLAIIVLLNLIFTTNLDSGEHAVISINSILYIIATISLSIVLICITNILNEYLYNNKNEKFKKKLRKILFFSGISLYLLFNILWVIFVKPPVGGDSVHVANLAQTFYRGNTEEFLPNMTYAGIPLIEYMQAYPQQVSLAFVYSVIFRLIHFDVMEILRIINIIGNLLIVIALFKITNQLSKTYRTNKVLMFTLILTFISLPMLTTFIYGDILSIALCLFSVYFMMKYTENKKIIYPIISSLLTMLAYMMRMNSLIFIIATVIYLTLNLFIEIKQITIKENLLKLLIIVLYIMISIIPASIVKNYYCNKFNLDKNKEYPSSSYILMAMEEGPRANGWYNEEIAEKALKNPENIEAEYIEKIKERLIYFSKNIGYAFRFYTKKIASMWTENTYSAIYNNLKYEDDKIEDLTGVLTFYQKSLLIVTCFCSLVVIIQNRKNLTLELIFLLTIFIGGFTFHLLWEAKSRYIIPYIIVLIPIASVGTIFKNFKFRQLINLKKFLNEEKTNNKEK